MSDGRDVVARFFVVKRRPDFVALRLLWIIGVEGLERATFTGQSRPDHRLVLGGQRNKAVSANADSAPRTS
jgi:hypothetical protein